MKVNTLSVVIGDGSCNFSCPYCVSKMTGKDEPADRGYLEPQKNASYWRNLYKACELAARSGATTCLLTGKGEPTLFPIQIDGVLKRVQEYFPVVELQTNGQKLMTLDEMEVHSWYLNGLTTIALSMVHYDEELNKQTLCPHNKHYHWNASIVTRMHQLGFSIRLSVVMALDYIDDPDSVQQMIGISRDLYRAEQLTFTPVARPDESRDPEVEAWVKLHELSSEEIERVRRSLDIAGTRLMTLPHGAIVYDVERQNVCLSNCLTIDPNCGEDNLRQLIYFPDGSLRYDWRYPGAIIF